MVGKVGSEERQEKLRRGSSKDLTLNDLLGGLETGHVRISLLVNSFVPIIFSQRDDGRKRESE